MQGRDIFMKYRKEPRGAYLGSSPINCLPSGLWFLDSKMEKHCGLVYGDHQTKYSKWTSFEASKIIFELKLFTTVYRLVKKQSVVEEPGTTEVVAIYYRQLCKQISPFQWMSINVTLISLKWETNRDALWIAGMSLVGDPISR